jgi:hypothetical protein
MKKYKLASREKIFSVWLLFGKTITPRINRFFYWALLPYFIESYKNRVNYLKINHLSDNLTQ